MGEKPENSANLSAYVKVKKKKRLKMSVHRSKGKPEEKIFASSA